MHRRPAPATALLLSGLLALLPSTAAAAWLPGGTLLWEEHITNVALPFETVPDGRGGLFVAMTAHDGPFSLLQEINASGETQLGEDLLLPGVGANDPFYTFSPDFNRIPMVPDGEGGVFVAMVAGSEIFVHHRDAGGASVNGWPEGGVRVGTLPALGEPRLIPAPRGGVFVVGSTGGQLYSQELGPGGQQLSGGSVPLGDFIPTDLQGDARGGILGIGPTVLERCVDFCNVPYTKFRATCRRWSVGGGQLRQTEEVFLGPVQDGWVGEMWSARDPSGGAVVVWLQASDRARIYAARVTEGGGTPWGAPVLLRESDSPTRPDVLEPIASIRVLRSSRGRTLVAWLEGFPGFDRIEARVQSIGPDGRTDWADGGVVVASGPSFWSGLAVAQDGMGGAYVASADGLDLRVRRVTADGQSASGWPANGFLVGSGRSQLAYLNSFVEVRMNEVAPRQAIVTWFWGPGENAFVNAMLVGPDGPAATPSPSLSDQSAAAGFADRPSQLGSRPTLAIAAIRPNPAGLRFSVSFSLGTSEPAQLAVFDIAGRSLWDRAVSPVPGGHIESVDMGRTVAAGIYCVRLTQGARCVTRRMVIDR